MAKNPKSTIEKLMPGYRVVERQTRARAVDSGPDEAPPPAELHGIDFAKLQELYLGSSSAAASRSIDQSSGARNTSKLFPVEKQSLMDTPAVGRKTVIFDEDDDTIVGRQG